MGALFSRPSTPRARYVPPIAPLPKLERQNDDTAQDEIQEKLEQQKEKNLLRRSRGRAATILSGYDGVQSFQLADGNTKKSLLGA